MLRGTYIRTPEIRKKCSLVQTGRKHVWTKGFKPEYVVWNKGKTLSLEIRKKISEATKKAMTLKICSKISLSKVGTHQTEEHRKAISLGNKGKTAGSLHYNWKGGNPITIGDTTYTDRARVEWRLNVYRRDGFLCRGCKTPGKRLNAHHILPKSVFPERQFDVDNGMTLCVDCHSKTDSYCVNKKYISLTQKQNV
jgi:5-methylcytosine-specific restriction endonuclease McrA